MSKERFLSVDKPRRDDMPKERLTHESFDDRVLAAMKPARPAGTMGLLQQLKARAQQMPTGRQPVRQVPQGR